MPILPIAAQVAGDEPVSAENNAQAPMLLMTSEPGTRCSQRASASYRSLPARDEATAAPMMMNIGSETSVKSDRPAKIVSGRKLTRVPAVEDDHEEQRHRAEAEGDRQTGGEQRRRDDEDQQADGQRCHSLTSGAIPNGWARRVNTRLISAMNCRHSKARPTGTDR